MKKIELKDIASADEQTLQLEDGFTLHIECEPDHDTAEPWKEHDGHGPVSGWESRDKKPGEWILCAQHGFRRRRRFYDVQGAMVRARQDGWGLNPNELELLTRKLGRTPTAGEVFASAVESDYDYLRGWCRDEWQWMRVSVSLIGPDDETISSESCGGIESRNSYWREYALETANSLLELWETECAHNQAQAEKERAEAQHWAERDVETVGGAS